MQLDALIGNSDTPRGKIRQLAALNGAKSGEMATEWSLANRLSVTPFARARARNADLKVDKVDNNGNVQMP